eukprot:TRINITY_DN7506_c0_g1_i2.p1 TRINITY_DN7506_c0_g1~~TRINITY_DN7506_c0_g1_i2.p1  ORF type:complete len:341 (+),score=84.39 TRINITY_DN7506_c0_g1_i2:107-1129(+)
MAKWGEGDPRWIVEERPDAKNPGNWHWSEKDATKWSKDRLSELLSDLAIESDAGSIRTTDVSVTGEATANNRKAKLIFLYELVVDVKWKGKTADGRAVNGKLHVPNLSEEYEIDEVDTEVSMTTESNNETDAVKELARKKYPALVTEQLHKWYKALKEEYSSGLVLPTKEAAKAPSRTSKPAPAASKDVGVKIHSQKSSKAAGQLSCESFTLREEFACPAQLVFETLMDEQRVSSFTQAQAKIDSRVGGQFKMFGGSVEGVIKDLVPYKRIAQAWRFSSWAEGHFSDVEIDLSEGNGKTTLTLKQSNVPDSDIERTRNGWSRLQFEPMKALLGVGGMPFM